jgi:hypothetical protein
MRNDIKARLDAEVERLIGEYTYPGILQGLERVCRKAANDHWHAAPHSDEAELWAGFADDMLLFHQDVEVRFQRLFRRLEAKKR